MEASHGKQLHMSRKALETMIDTSLNIGGMTDAIQLKGISGSVVDKAGLLLQARLIKY